MPDAFDSPSTVLFPPELSGRSTNLKRSNMMRVATTIIYVNIMVRILQDHTIDEENVTP